MVSGLVIIGVACVGIAAYVHSRGSRSHARSTDETVLVEEDVSNLRVGSIVHLCLEKLPCRANVVRAAGQTNPPQLVTLPLPTGVTAKQASGWTLRAWANSAGVAYRGTTRVVYHIAVDPLCTCAGDYAYLKLRPVRP
jgi:hypothetical protein